MKRKLLIVVTTEMTVRTFLFDHIKALSATYDVTVALNTDDPGFLRDMGVANVQVVPIRIERSIRPLSDLSCLAELWKLMRRQRFDLVFSVTPKGGLLGMLAGFIARIPVRIHIFTGQVWVTKTGLLRTLLKSVDKLIGALATRLLTDSESQREFLSKEGVVPSSRSTVLANGSICGVNLERFRPDDQARKDIRAGLGLPAGAVVILFVGRLNRDKGVMDLAAAMRSLVQNGVKNINLLIVGPDEQGMRPDILATCASFSEDVHFVDFTHQPQSYMAAADIFCLPSYREGFGSVVIEAAATGLPAVASRIYGLTDAVEEGETGLLFEPGNVDELSACLQALIIDAALRRRMGESALRRTVNLFAGPIVTRALVAYFDDCK